MARRRKTPQYYYNNQRQSAKVRGIEWEFTFETWWAVWEASGKWEQRGKRTGQYCMARNGDTGPYAPWNVRIVQVSENNRDGMKDWQAKKKAREAHEMEGAQVANANLRAPQDTAAAKIRRETLPAPINPRWENKPKPTPVRFNQAGTTNLKKISVTQVRSVDLRTRKNIAPVKPSSLLEEFGKIVWRLFF
jgi:hypothetical protein